MLEERQDDLVTVSKPNRIEEDNKQYRNITGLATIGVSAKYSIAPIEEK